MHSATVIRRPWNKLLLLAWPQAQVQLQQKWWRRRRWWSAPATATELNPLCLLLLQLPKAYPSKYHCSKLRPHHSSSAHYNHHHLLLIARDYDHHQHPVFTTHHRRLAISLVVTIDKSVPFVLPVHRLIRTIIPFLPWSQASWSCIIWPSENDLIFIPLNEAHPYEQG